MKKAINENIYDAFFDEYGKMYGVEPHLLKAQVKAESAFNPKAKSPVGAKGLAQFMPATWKEWGGGTDILDPESNIKAQARYMSWLLQVYKGNFKLALSAYNWGCGNLNKLIHRLDTKDYAGLMLHLPKETSAYVGRICNYKMEYDTNKGGDVK